MSFEIDELMSFKLMSTFTHQFSWAAQVMSCETHHSSSQKSD
jgi:hypothetical protein